MALPVLPDQVAPTSGPLPSITNANISLPYASGGGGGGGGGGSANPVVSTLTFSQGVQSGNTNGTINMTSALNILDPAVSTPQNFHFQFATNQNPGDYPLYVSEYQSTFNSFGVWGPSSDNVNTGNFGFSTDILGRSQIFAANATGALSTLVLSADSVLVPTGMNISSLTVSSINGAAYPPAAALPEDAGFNNLQCSTLAANTSVSIGGFEQPVIVYGAITLNGSGTASVGLDRQYADPYYPFVCYRGTLGANTSTLSVSTVNADTFNIYGEANTQVQYMVVGN